MLSLPVCEDDGTVIGSVDVMDIIYGCGGAEGWRSIFDKSDLLADDMSDTFFGFVTQGEIGGVNDI